MNRRVFIILMLLAVSALTSTAHAVSLNSTGDSFGYEFLANSNWNVGFGEYLPAGNTTTGHNMKSAIQFDLAGVGLTGSQVQSATLDLWVIPTEDTGFGVSPSAGRPRTRARTMSGAR